MRATSEIISEMTTEQKLAFRAKKNEIYNNLFAGQVYESKNMEYCEELALRDLGIE